MSFCRFLTHVCATLTSRSHVLVGGSHGRASCVSGQVTIDFSEPLCAFGLRKERLQLWGYGWGLWDSSFRASLFSACHAATHVEQSH